jgi:hypothetical protein
MQKQHELEFGLTIPQGWRGGDYYRIYHEFVSGYGNPHIKQLAIPLLRLLYNLVAF